MFKELSKLGKECKDIFKDEWKKSFNNKSVTEYVKSTKDYKQIQYSLNKIKKPNKNNFEL